MTGMSPALDGLDVRLPAAGWAVLDAVRTHAFTGELTLIGAPPVRVWADRGRIYLAEQLEVPPLAARLLAAGVLTPGELARGVVRVADREHLGALFERAPGADRHAVQAAVSGFTEAALRLIAGQQLAAAEVVPYAFDPAGVHAWASGVPISPAPSTTPAPAAPGFAAPPAGAVPTAGPNVPVAAAQPVPTSPGPPVPPAATAQSSAPAPAPASVAAAPAHDAAPTATATVTAAPAIDWDHLPYLDRLVAEREGRDTEPFSVIWPDGDVERRPGAHGANGINGAAAANQSAGRPNVESAILGVPVGTRTRLLDDRFGAL